MGVWRFGCGGGLVNPAIDVQSNALAASAPTPLHAHPPTLVVIVVSYNVRDLLRACLRTTYASLALSPELDATVWVLDNASADGSAEMVAAEFPQVHLVAGRENLGFAGGNNLVLRELGFRGAGEQGSGGAEEQVSGGAGEQGSRGAGEQGSRGAGEQGSRGAGEQGSRGVLREEQQITHHAPRTTHHAPRTTHHAPRTTHHDQHHAPRTTHHAPRTTHHAPRLTLLASLPDIVLLLNPDAEPVGDAIGQMARFLSDHPECGGVGAQLRYPDGRFQHGAFRFPGLLQLWFDLFPPRPRRLLDSRLNGRYPRALYEAGRPFPIDFALGASLMVRREAIGAAGLLDEGYFMYAEEVDWCWRIRRAGWPFYCVPSAVVIHHGGASARQFRSEAFVNLWRSRKRLYDRFYGSTRRWLAGRIVRLGMLVEVQRAKRAAARGEITGDDLAARLGAVQAVKTLFDME